MNNLSFGQWLRQHRKATDITQEELAERLGCSRTAIQKIEVGERRPSKQVVELLAEMFEVAPEEHEAFVRFARLGKESGVGSRESASLPNPQLPAPNPRLPSLPTPLTGLIGRERDVETARDQLLNDRTRALTLIGPPGIGKTRLSLRLAADMAQLAWFPDGVVFVALAPIADPELVLTTIADAFGLKQAEDKLPVEQLKDHLRDRAVLAVLDNFEQVVEAAPYVAELLRDCPHLKVLATSREPLHLSGERRFLVPPLELPDVERLPDVGVLSVNPAVALFIERAQDIDPKFELTEGNAWDVAEICRRLDGVPLAIELVAARSGLFPPASLLERLDKPLALLTGGSRDLPARHRTLLNAIAWSHDLLDEGEQILFARLGVFIGGCTLPAVQAVCDAHGDLPVDVLDGVASLLDKSLIRRESGTDSRFPIPDSRLFSDATRFTFLETIREYALERLTSRGEWEELRSLHAQYYLALVEAAEPELRGVEQARWFSLLEREHDNLRAVLKWSMDAGDPLQEGRFAPDDGRRTMDDGISIVHRPSLANSGPVVAEGKLEIGLGLAGALHWFWQMRGYLREGRSWLESLLARSGADTWTRAKALDALGYFAMLQSDLDAARRAHEGSLEINRKLGDKDGIARSLSGLGNIAFSGGDGDQARRFHEESLALRRVAGDTPGIAASLNNLGLVTLRQGDLARAQEVLSEGLVLARQTGNKERVGLLLNNLGRVFLRQGEYEKALLYLREGLSMMWEVGYKMGVALTLGTVAEVFSDSKQSHRRATLLFAKVESLYAELGVKTDPAESAHYEQTLEALRRTLGEKGFTQAWEEGASYNLDQIIALALEES